MSILEIKNLRKKYGDSEVVKGISFKVESGEILGFLGPNGAGKSTTINMISTALGATSGNIIFNGINIDKDKKNYKSNIGIVPQSLAIFDNLPAIENVIYFASFYGLRGKKLKEKAQEALSMVGLLDKANDLPKTFSGGMKRRLNIACALAHSPRLLILDEPTVGIDPQSRNYILESIKTLRKNGTTVIYTTHYMEEVEAISDRVIIIDKGEIIAQGTLEELKSKISDNIIYNIYGENIEKVDIEKLSTINGIVKIENKDTLKINCLKEVDNLDKIILNLIDNNIKIKSIITEEQNLEAVFLNLTGKSLRD